jgi:hypothetical protein
MMTPEQFRLAIERLGLSQVRAARLFGANERSARRWATGETDIPIPVELCLKLMVRHDVSPAEALKMIGEAPWNPPPDAD